MARQRSGADVAPPTNRTLVAIAAVLLAIPLVALLWVSSYAHDTPELGGVPFFFWYQFLWVFLCAGCTYAAHRLVLAARKPGAGTTGNPGRITPADGADGAPDRAAREEGDR